MQAKFPSLILVTFLTFCLGICFSVDFGHAIDSPAYDSTAHIGNKIQLTGLPPDKALPGEYIIKYKEGFSSDTRLQVMTKSNFKEGKKFKLINAKHITLSKELDSLEQAALLEEIKKDPRVEYIEPNYRLYPLQDLTPISTDPGASQQWGLKNYGQSINGGPYGTPGMDINLEPAWPITRGNPNVVVAVIDSGIDINHPDICNNIWTNPGEGTFADEIDNDNNGFIDDLHGWDFYYGDNTVYHNATEDKHGTHCAGIIAGMQNDIGVVGVAPQVKIMPLKFIGSNESGSIDGAIAAIEYAKNMGIKIVNCSWGGSFESPPLTLQEAIAGSGMLFIAAAGNEGTNNDYDSIYPACYDLDNIISVAAIDNRGQLGSFSNYGVNTVDVAAPGAVIYSTVPEAQYAYLSGTSMATPHVAGIAALIASNGISDINTIKSKIMDSASQHQLSSLSGKVLTGGLVDTRHTLNAPPQAGNLNISGSPETGQELTATYDYSDAEQDPQGISIIRWYRADSSGMENWTEISGASNVKYTLTEEDMDKYIFFGVVPVAASGFSPGQAVYSTCLGPVIQQPPVDECFIATAAFGSKLAPAVKLLRMFRDDYLLTNPWGTAFVKFYYHHSPPLANQIATSEILRAFVRTLLLPVIAIVYLLYHQELLPFCILILAIIAYWKRDTGTVLLPRLI